MKKVILITGASSGIGKATAKKLINEGYIVYAAARRTEKMKDLKKLGGHILEIDVTNENMVKNGVDRVIEEQGRIDVLFNNAGFGQYGSVEETSIDTARYQFEVNLFGLARVTQLVLPHMRKQKSGKIINTSSMGGKIYTPLGAWYHATKHALEGWSDALRLELKQYNIDVVIIEPGIIDTDFYEAVEKSLPEGSRNGPYKNIVDGLEKASQSGAFNGSSPNVIAEVVSKAIKAKNPRTRYIAGKMARPTMFIRKWLGDRIFDRVIMSQMQ